MFVISVFGRADHPIWETKHKAYLAKIGLCISGCGALLNVLSLSTPSVTEIVLNIGLSLNFCWISWWQYGETKKVKATPKKRKRTGHNKNSRNNKAPGVQDNDWL
jgi:hypothetical protein